MDKRKTMIYLVRHGETEWNLTHRLQGSTDVPLNKTGRRQAKAIAKHLASVSLEIIYSSPLSRAKETAHIIAKKQHKNKIVTEPLLLERSFGTHEGVSLEEFDASIPGFNWVDSWRYTGLRSPEGESLKDVNKRAYQFVRKLQASDYRSIAIVSHGVTLRLIAGLLLQIPMGYLGHLEMSNASLTIIEVGPTGAHLHLSDYKPQEKD